MNAAARWPTISVIVPAYNCERWLARALDSAILQHYPPDRFEIVVVDDGSTDRTFDVATRYAARDPRVVVQRQANAGPAAARNRGIDAAYGELIAFLDADDRWHPDKLAEQAKLFVADPGLGLVHCGCRFVDEHGHALERWVRSTSAARGDILLDVVCDFFLITSAVMIPRERLVALGGFDESLRVGEDNDLFLRLLADSRADCVDAPLLERTVRADSLSRQDFDLDARNDLLILDRFLAQHPRFMQQHRRAIHARYARYLYDYGYRLLEHGQVQRARRVLLDSLKHRATFSAAKALLRASLPAAVVQPLRSA